MKDFIKKHYIKIILIIIIILQIVTIIYSASKRERLHMDEYLSYGFISSEDMYINNKADFYNTWHTNNYYYEYLEVNEDEKSNFLPVYENQKKDVHPPLYYLLLRIFSNFNIDNFSMWTGIILNIVLYIISICIVYLIGQKLFNSKKYSLLLCFVVGFNIGIIQIVIYIRMYQLLILSTLLLLYWHLCKKDKESLGLKDCIQLILIVCMGFLTHYYYSIMVVGFYIVHCIRKIKAKQFKELVKYTLTLILSLALCTIIFPHWIEHMFFSGRGKEAIGYILTRPEYLKYILGLYVNMLNRDVFNKFLYALMGVLGCLAVYYIYNKIKNRKENEKIVSKGMAYIIFPAIFYFIFIACLAPYIEFRYFSPIIVFIFIFLVYYLKLFLESLLKSDKLTYVILIMICMMTSFVSILKINNNIFSYKDEAKALESISNNNNLALIYIKNPLAMEMYNSYEVFLNYENSIFLLNNEQIVDNIKSVIIDKNLEKNEYVIGIDRDVYENVKNKLSETNEFRDLTIEHIIGKNVFLSNPE